MSTAKNPSDKERAIIDTHDELGLKPKHFSKLIERHRTKMRATCVR